MEGNGPPEETLMYDCSLASSAESDGADLTLLASDSDFPLVLVLLGGRRLDGLSNRGEQLLALLVLSFLVLEDMIKGEGEVVLGIRMKTRDK